MACVGLWAWTSVASAAEAAGERAEIHALYQSFDDQTKTWTAQGDVLIQYKGATLRADRVRYNRDTQDAWAEGNVRLNRAGQEWLAPSLYYNFDTHAMKSDDVRGFFDPVFVRAEHVSLVGSNHYTAPRATLTTCDLDPPDFRLQASHAEVYPNDRITAFNTSLWLGPVPVFWLPVATWSLKGDYQPLSVAVGQNSRWGPYILTTTTFELNPDLQLAIHLDERVQRGFGEGADLKYRTDKDVQGLLRGYYLNDADARDSANPTVGKSLPTSRWLGEWQHKEEFAGNLTLTIDANKQSDRAVVEDFFPREFRQNSEPDSVADLTKRGDNYTISALVRPQFNSFFNEVERLPEVKWSVNRVRIFDWPVFYESESSVGYYNNYRAPTNDVPFDPLFTGDTLRADTFHQLVSPQLLFGWLSFVPRAGGRYTYYQRAPDFAPNTQEVKRVVADLGAETSFKLTRTWSDAQNQTLGIDGLRHIVQPFADYQWVPTPNVKSNDLFQFDTVRFATLRNGESLVASRYLPLDMPAFDAIDALDRENTVRFGLRQRLQTRRDGRPWDLIELTGWTDFHIEKDNGQRDFSEFFGTLEVRPSDWVALDSFARYDLHGSELRELNNEARFGNIDQWSIGLGTRYLKDDSNLVAGSLTWRLGRRWVAQVYERFDMQDGQWEEQEYQLRQETHDWYITYGFRYRSQRTQRDETTVFVAVTLKAFPGVRLAVN